MCTLLFSCTKQEFFPPPIGEQIPYEDTVTSTLTEVLAQTPQSLFYRAWQRTGFQDVLSQDESPKSAHTVLVPDDAALNANGWDEYRIDHAPISELEDLLRAHVLVGLVELKDVLGRPDSYLSTSLLTYPDLLYAEIGSYNVISYVPYRFKVAMAMRHDVLLLNGKQAGNGSPVLAVDGCIWPINRILDPPTKTAWQTLEGDGRFRIYTQLLQKTDSIYREIFELANGYPPSNGHIGERIYDRNSARYYDLTHHYSSTANGYYAENLNTWFIPTDDAFRDLGFQSVEDVLAFNEARGLPHPVWTIPGVSGQTPFYRVEGEFASDTLLDYHHNWGRRIAAFDLTRSRNATLFYSNDLSSELLHNYPLSVFTTSASNWTTSVHYMPFDFYDNAGIQIRLKDSDQSATLVETDISSLNGVIHAVNRLLVPEGFRLD